MQLRSSPMLEKHPSISDLLELQARHYYKPCISPPRPADLMNPLARPANLLCLSDDSQTAESEATEACTRKAR